MIFPPEIINDTTESLFVKRSTKSNIIYLTVVLIIAAAIISLPFIYVEISTQARGIIRTPFENNQLQTAVYGEIIKINIVENMEVKKGDTLLVLNAEHIQEQINRKKEKIKENTSFIEDIYSLLSRQNTKAATPGDIPLLVVFPRNASGIPARRLLHARACPETIPERHCRFLCSAKDEATFLKRRFV